MKTAFKDIQIVSRLGVDERTLAFDVLDGLTRPFKEIPPKHFYDTEGSRLFEAITKLPEYYPTRTEREILETHAADIVEMTGMAELVELGSGVPTKTLLLLDAMREAGTLDRYMPFDVSEVVLRESAEEHVRAIIEGEIAEHQSAAHLIADHDPPRAEGHLRAAALLLAVLG